MWGKKKRLVSVVNALARILPKPEPRWKRGLRAAAHAARAIGNFAADTFFGVRCALRDGAWPWRDKKRFLDVLDAAAWTSDALRDLKGGMKELRADGADQQFTMEWNTAQRSATGPDRPSLSAIFSHYAAAVDMVIESRKALADEYNKHVSETGIGNWREYRHISRTMDEMYERARALRDVHGLLDLMARKTAKIPESAQETLFTMAAGKMKRAELLPPDYAP